MTREELRAALAHPNVQAFLRVVREGESSQGPDAYRTMFGGGAFSSFADHPRQANSAAGLTSTAAGAYQFLEKTWDGLVAKYGFPDFSPACQDEAAVALIAGRGALQDLLRGDLSEVLDKCSWEWASLPPSRYNQPTLDAKRVYATYEKWLHPTEQPDTSEKPMASPAFIAIAFQALSELLPTLIRMKSKSATGEVNAQLAEKVMPIVTAAVGASNAQEAVEKIASDPAVLQVADKAVQEKYYELVEAGGGGIEGAREFAVRYAGAPPNRPLENVTYGFLAIFGVSVLLVLGNAAYRSMITGDHVSMVVQAIIGVSLMVGGFWLGSSYTTSRSRGIGDGSK